MLQNGREKWGACAAVPAFHHAVVASFAPQARIWAMFAFGKHPLAAAWAVALAFTLVQCARSTWSAAATALGCFAAVVKIGACVCHYLEHLALWMQKVAAAVEGTPVLPLIAACAACASTRGLATALSVLKQEKSFQFLWSHPGRSFAACPSTPPTSTASPAAPNLFFAAVATVQYHEFPYQLSQAPHLSHSYNSSPTRQHCQL